MQRQLFLLISKIGAWRLSRKHVFLLLSLPLMYFLTRKTARRLKASARVQPSTTQHYHLGFSMFEADKHPEYLSQLHFMLHTLLKHSSVYLHFHVLVQSSDDFVRARDVVVDVADELVMETPLVSEVPIGELVAARRGQVKNMMSILANPGEKFYKESIAVYPFLHDLKGVSEIALIDTDLMFEVDIKGLFMEFQRFPETAFIGCAPELNPSFFDNLARYREENPDTELGSSHPKHLQGLNTGVLLLKVDRMRNSTDYEYYVSEKGSSALLDKYHFTLGERRNLAGHQDFFTPLSYERPDMFYFLSCGWNRNLCGGTSRNEFDVKYHACNDTVKVYHSNCGSSFPARERAKAWLAMLLSHV